MYVASFFVVFDLGDTAVSWDEESYLGRQVAIGPHPREVFCRPSHWGTCYDTGQWPFRLYRPLCEVWLRLKGFAPPVEWRG